MHLLSTPYLTNTINRNIPNAVTRQQEDDPSLQAEHFKASSATI